MRRGRVDRRNLLTGLGAAAAGLVLTTDRARTKTASLRRQWDAGVQAHLLEFRDLGYYGVLVDNALVSAMKVDLDAGEVEVIDTPSRLDPKTGGLARKTLKGRIEFLHRQVVSGGDKPKDEKGEGGRSR